MTEPTLDATKNWEPEAATPDLYLGFDWGDKRHAFEGQDRTGKRFSGTLEHSSENLHRWLQELGQNYRSVFLALEGLPVQVMPVLVQYPWLKVYPVNPVTSERFRTAFTPSGATNDVTAAQNLLDLVRAHADKLRPWEALDPETEKLDLLVQARRDMVDRRTQLVLKLTSLLKSFYPQALSLAGELDSNMALEFLRRWPDLLSLKAARTATLKSFYYRNNVRSTELVERRLALIQSAVALTTNEAYVSVAVLQVRQLVDELAVFQKHVPQLDEAIAQAFKAHPEAYLYRELPGAGRQMAPRLCAAFGTDRQRYPSAADLQKYAGVAPVLERSGNQQWVHWRWNAPTFLRQTLVEWAGLTVKYCPWAKRYYDHMKNKGKRHAVILRALAFKWLRVLWKCWQTRTPYDEARYLKQLARRKSPYAV